MLLASTRSEPSTSDCLTSQVTSTSGPTSTPPSFGSSSCSGDVMVTTGPKASNGISPLPPSPPAPPTLGRWDEPPLLTPAALPPVPPVSSIGGGVSLSPHPAAAPSVPTSAAANHKKRM